jgi:hypothetical protein
LALRLLRFETMGSLVAPGTSTASASDRRLTPSHSDAAPSRRGCFINRSGLSGCALLYQHNLAIATG